jgi:hypothetical protein
MDFVNAATNLEESVDSWVAAADAMYSFGPFYVRGLGYVAQNLTTYGAGAPAVALGLFPTQFVGTSFADVDNWGFFGVAGFKFNDMIAVEAGWGTRNSERDAAIAGLKDEDNASAFVLFVPISITPAHVITPEILLTDEGDFTINGVAFDRGKKLFYGIYWRIDF